MIARSELHTAANLNMWYCELAGCLDYDVILMTEEHYDCESKSRPDWCPLKPLPEEKEEEYWRSKLSLAWIRGWNTCISKITGGEVDGEINGRFRNR